MRKLLIMASLFPPQKNGGGPPVSIMNVVQAIKNDFEIYIISQNHEVGDSKPLPGITDGWNEFDFGKVFYCPYGKHASKDIYPLIEEIKPDVIYQNSFFSHNHVLPVLKYKKKHKEVGIVIAPRGEICENRFKQGYLKKSVYTKALRMLGYMKNVYLQATGDEELRDMVKYMGVPAERIYNINNFSYADESQIKPIPKEKGDLKLCYIARIQDTKNLLYGVERLKNIKGNVTYDIYGPIENREYYDKCFAVELPENVKLNYCGSVDHEDVGKTVSKYHAYYMPTIGENYGHSIVEGMIHKRPIIISDTTPWNGINQANGGCALPLSAPEKFEQAIEAFCDMEQAEYDLICDNAKAFIDSKLKIDEIIKQYIDCFNEV